jgi:ATP-binding cassette subfamily B protein
MMDRTTEPKSTIVMLQGNPGKQMFVIRKGKVQIFRREEEGKERFIGTLGEGDSFGERALLMGKPYSETALTLTECEISTIDLEKLKKVADKYPSLRRTIDSYLTHSGLDREREP